MRQHAHACAGDRACVLCNNYMLCARHHVLYIHNAYKKYMCITDVFTGSLKPSSRWCLHAGTLSILSGAGQRSEVSGQRSAEVRGQWSVVSSQWSVPYNGVD